VKLGRRTVAGSRGGRWGRRLIRVKTSACKPQALSASMFCQDSRVSDSPPFGRGNEWARGRRSESAEGTGRRSAASLILSRPLWRARVTVQEDRTAPSRSRFCLRRCGSGSIVKKSRSLATFGMTGIGFGSGGVSQRQFWRSMARCRRLSKRRRYVEMNLCQDRYMVYTLCRAHGKHFGAKSNRDQAAFQVPLRLILRIGRLARTAVKAERSEFIGEP
jgi:hypothetical protein